MTVPAKQTVTVKQAADELQIAYNTALRWIREGILPAADLMDGLRRPVYRIRREDLDALLARGVDREALKPRTPKPPRPTPPPRPAMPTIPQHF